MLFGECVHSQQDSQKCQEKPGKHKKNPDKQETDTTAPFNKITHRAFYFAFIFRRRSKSESRTSQVETFNKRSRCHVSAAIC